jgi:hypothetical protein
MDGQWFSSKDHVDAYSWIRWMVYPRKRLSGLRYQHGLHSSHDTRARVSSQASFTTRMKHPIFSNSAGTTWVIYLGSMPGFSQKSPICQAAMLAFSEGLRHYNGDTWETLPVADAPGKLSKIANDAAISRLRPIADGPNQWDMHRSSAHTVCQSSLGAAMGTESGAGTGSMDTCVACRNPS